MKIIVQKFGGTSVATADGRANAMERIINAKAEGYSPVVVVSAMGRKGEPYATDTLIDIVRSIDKDVESRELDLLISCGEIISSVVMAQSLKAQGHPAVALTGGQAGIKTDGNFGNAKITKIDPEPIVRQLEKGKIVIVAGFQGMCEDGSVTTLGRGGSDTTATALGGALEADLVEIYTDVDGIMTTDPRILPEAHILEGVTYKEICEMAHQGAKVIHPRAVEVAMASNVPVKIKNTFSDAEGTLISDDTPERVITGIAHINDIAQIGVITKNGVDVQLAKVKVFDLMANSGISLDLINVTPEEIYFTVKEELADKAIELLHGEAFETKLSKGCAKISVVGSGMQGLPGVMAKLVKCLYDNGISIFQTSDSDITISFLIKQENLKKAVTLLHNNFC